MMETIFILAVTIILTFVVGTFTGYLLHLLLHSRLARFSYLRKVAKSHNVHHTLYNIHDFESDEYRSAGKDDSIFAFIPVITLAIGLLSLSLWFAFHAWWIYPIILVEGIFVGWLNERMHEWFHIKNHWLNKYKLFRALKHLHWLHHKYPKDNHGIIWFIPDKIFGTFRKK